MSSSGILVMTDPDQEKNGFYKICKTANQQQTLTVMNSARANKDFKVVKFCPTSDMKKAEDFIRQALAKKIISSSEWYRLPGDELSKALTKIETLISIVDDK